MIRQVICGYASVFCTLSFVVRCCRGLTSSLEKKVFHFLRFFFLRLPKKSKDFNETSATSLFAVSHPGLKHPSEMLEGYDDHRHHQILDM